MRVLMHTRSDWREVQGGDTVQLHGWTTGLRGLGVAIDCVDEVIPDLTGVELVHLNNLGRAHLLWPTLEHCRKAGVATILTPLYWPTDEYHRRGRPGLAGRVSGMMPRSLRDRLEALVRWARSPKHRGTLLSQLWQGGHATRQRFVRQFDAIVVNSRAEAEQLAELVPDHPPLHVVHSPVDCDFWLDGDWRSGVFSRTAAMVRTTPPPARRHGVLCVARFDPQKNLHRLIQALAPLQIPLTLVGTDNPNYPGYRSYCRRHAGPEVKFLDRQDHAGLRELYRQCQVLAQCSWYETTGLTGLEASLCGARVVMTDRGGFSEYGRNLAWYADPTDLWSIRKAMVAALAATSTPDLAGHVQRNFSFAKTASTLRDVYENVLAYRSARRSAA